MARKWTVMVYLGADNNLSVDFLWDLKEMQDVMEVGPEKEVTVVAQYDPGQGIRTQRYIINKESVKGPPKYLVDGKDGWLILDNEEIPDVRKDAELEKLVRELMEKVSYAPAPKEGQLNRLGKYLDRLTFNGDKIEPGNKNTGDPMTLLQFILWGINRYEAKRYMVLLAGHGSGAVEDFLLKDESSRDSLTLHELRDVFQLVQKKLQLRLEALQHEENQLRDQGGQLGSEQRKRLEELKQLLDGKRDRLDILGMDSCLMSMAEVYYQLVGSVDYLVGAEGFEPSGGWPYQRILDSLVEHSNDATEKIAMKIVDDYVLYYFDYALAGLSVDLSACKIVEADSLAGAIKDLGSKLKAILENRASRDIVISARQKAQSYKFDQYVDLVDFCHQLESDTRSSQDCCGDVRRAVEAVVKNSSYVGPDYQKSNGLSVYFPWNSVPEKFSEGYEQLEFTRRTNGEWRQFVGKFTETMRALQLAAPEETTLPAGKTLYSARTLFSGRTSQGPGEPFYMAYSKVPSIVWKPREKKPPDVIDKHFQALEREELIKDLSRGELIALNKAGLALLEDRLADRRNQREPRGQDQRQGDTFVSRKHQGAPGGLIVYGPRDLLGLQKQRLEQLVTSNADIEELRGFSRQLPVPILQSVSGKAREVQNDLAEYLGVVEQQPKDPSHPERKTA